MHVGGASDVMIHSSIHVYGYCTDRESSKNCQQLSLLVERKHIPALMSQQTAGDTPLLVSQYILLLLGEFRDSIILHWRPS